MDNDTALLQLEAAQRGSSLPALSGSMIGLSTVAIGLRIWSRALLPHNRFQWDDFFAFLAWPIAVTLLSICIIGHRLGFGRHIVGMSFWGLSKNLKLLWAGFLLDDFALCFTRCSVLFFYKRVFQKDSRWFKIGINVGLLLNTVWIFTFMWTAIYVCSPVQKFWDPQVPGSCLSMIAINWGVSVTNVVLDLYLLLFPIPLLWKLQLRLGKKLLLTFVFCLGYGNIVLSLGRLVSFCQIGWKLDIDPTWFSITPEYWVVCEVSIGFISANIPSILHLARRGFLHGPGSLFSSEDYSHPMRSWIQRLYDKSIGRSSPQSDDLARLNQSPSETSAISRGKSPEGFAPRGSLATRMEMRREVPTQVALVMARHSGDLV